MQYLKQGTSCIIINNHSIELPTVILSSLEKRGKNSRNFLYNELDKSISIYCTSCKNYHKVYIFENNTWKDISANVYYKSTERKTGNEYFSSKCNFSNYNKSKNTPVKSISSELIKTTIVLTKENADYINIVSAITQKSKVDLLNLIISGEAKRKPLSKIASNIFLPDGQDN